MHHCTDSVGVESGVTHQPCHLKGGILPIVCTSLLRFALCCLVCTLSVFALSHNCVDLLLRLFLLLFDDFLGLALLPFDHFLDGLSGRQRRLFDFLILDDKDIAQLLLCLVFGFRANGRCFSVLGSLEHGGLALLSIVVDYVSRWRDWRR